MTKIVQLQYILRPSGDFAIRLHKKFMAMGLESSVVGLFSNTETNGKISSLGRVEQIKSRLDNRLQAYWLKNINKDYGSFSYPILGTDVTKLEQVKNADVIYLHWVLNGFFNLKSIEQLARLGKPIIFIMHDMWSMTGGCHYSFDCNKYQTQCNNCQMFTSTNGRDFAAKEFEKKLKLFAKFDNLFFVSPSKWLYDCAKASTILKDKPIYHIPNILDRGVFKSVDKTVAKSIFNVPADETVIAFGAVSVTSPYKGWSYLKDALIDLQKRDNTKNISVLIFGSSHNETMAKAIPFKTRFLGRLHDEYTVAMVYNAANVFIAPSLADNLPYTIFEALSSGTPVVAFNTGGIPDLVLHKENGYLAEYKNANDVANGIEFCLNNNLSGFAPSSLDNEPSLQKHFELINEVTQLSTIH